MPFVGTDLVKDKRVHIKLLLRGGGKRNMDVVKRDMKSFHVRLQTSLTASKSMGAVLKPVDEMNKKLELFGARVEADAKQAFMEMSNIMSDDDLAGAIKLLDKANTKASETKKQELATFLFGKAFHDMASTRDTINATYESTRTIIQYAFSCAVVQDNSFDFGTLKNIFEHQTSKRAGAREAMAGKGQGKGDVQMG